LLHTIEAPPALRSFDPVVFAQAYCLRAQSQAAYRLRDEIQRLTDRCGHQLVGSGICHNDLHAANILVGERVRLIDFEYAVSASPLVDVASYAAFNGLDEQAAVTFAMHCLDDDLPFSEEQLLEAVRIQRLLGELWEIARSDNNAPA
ncbi:MAG TPA: phosphotransferase, partial [Gammaproteobacteria bacterium]|nr:phosphotransferase [Gammaproteobacteria bacterium]